MKRRILQRKSKRTKRDLAYIKVDPFLDSLRDETRFEALVAEVFSHGGPSAATKP